MESLIHYTVNFVINGIDFSDKSLITTFCPAPRPTTVLIYLGFRDNSKFTVLVSRYMNKEKTKYYW